MFHNFTIIYHFIKIFLTPTRSLIYIEVIRFFLCALIVTDIYLKKKLRLDLMKLFTLLFAFKLCVLFLYI